MNNLKILAIYRGQMFENRGTPIRVRSLLSRFQMSGDLELSIASWDRSAPGFKNHLFLDNNHWRDIFSLIKYIRREKIEVVIGHTVSASYYLVPIKFLTRAKVVLEMHGFVEDEARAYGDIGFFSYWTLKAWYGFTYFICDLVTTCSKSVTDIILKFNKNTVSIYGGVDIDYFNPNVSSGHYFTKDDRIVIGYAGNARTWQGVDFLVDAYKKIISTNPEFRLVLLMSETKGLETAGLEIFGPLDNKDVPKFLIDCDILVIPRPDTPVTKISFPSKLTEYMAMGKPVVASCLGDMDQIIINDQNGLLYQPGDQQEFIKNILLLKDNNIRRRLGDRAYQTARDLSWDNQSELFVENIRKML